MTFHRTIHSRLIPSILHGIRIGLELRRRFFQAFREADTSPIWMRTVWPGRSRASSDESEEALGAAISYSLEVDMNRDVDNGWEGSWCGASVLKDVWNA